MPTPEEVKQQQAIQGAQQGVAPMNFDPQEIMQEIVQKDVQNQMKEQELAAREQQIAQGEQQLQAMNQQIQEEQAASEEQMQAQAQEQIAPVAPVEGPIAPPPPAQPGIPAQQQQSPGGPDLSEQMLQQLQPGMKATVTKKYEMGPQGPVEVGRTENVSGGGAPKQNPQQKPPQQGAPVQ